MIIITHYFWMFFSGMYLLLWLWLASTNQVKSQNKKIFFFLKKKFKITRIRIIRKKSVRIKQLMWAHIFFFGKNTENTEPCVCVVFDQNLDRNQNNKNMESGIVWFECWWMNEASEKLFFFLLIDSILMVSIHSKRERKKIIITGDECVNLDYTLI